MRLLILFLAVVTLLSLAGPGSAEVRRRRRRPPCEDVNGQCQPRGNPCLRLRGACPRGSRCCMPTVAAH
uniref:Venom-like beta-defensin n=1 Tax=Ornithorhynchus anatinus TaxID=9258 RepID=DEFBL_ORNAN|nr:RecName: Full=Venom-like beta-defensin; Short=DefB-vL; Short=Defensin-BvL; Short=OaDefB-vL; AltName: Full=Intermediate defensin-like peptide; Short=Int-DLP; AltName: Full=Ornithorhynchus venom defensin-like peptide; Short=OvDLP; Flags: Precursor [Ornithorhynchus anatinus]